MSRFIINIILVLCSFSMQAQLFDPIENGRAKHIRLSIDPTVPLKTYMQDADIMGLEVTIDTEVKQNLFLIGITGFSNTSKVSDAFNYKSNGAYLALGADVNLTDRPLLTDRDIFFMGLRYGISVFNQEVEGISISNPWGEYKANIPSETVNAGWFEIALGIKSEFAKNLFIGWTGEAKFKTHCKNTATPPYHIPGYGKFSDSRFAFDMNFFLSYAFTFKAKAYTTPEVIK